MSLWRRFLNLFRPRMSPLGERLAELLAPERWEEWRLGNSKKDQISGLFAVDVVHDGVGVALYVWEIDISPEVYVGLDGERLRPLLGWREQRHLAAAIRRLKNHLQMCSAVAAGERAEAAITGRLMTEEERAIEDLLR